MVVLCAAAVAFCDVASADDDSDTETANTQSNATYSITGEDAIGTESSEDYTLHFKEQNDSYETISISYTATLYRDGTSISSGVSPSSGSISDGDDVTLTVASQKTAGTYTLTVVIVEKVKYGTDDEQTYEYTVSQTIRIIEPITLSITVHNSGSVAFTDAVVVFYLDGKLIEGSEQDLNVAANSSTTVTYKYVPKDLSSGSHTFYILNTEGGTINGIGEDYAITFYYNQGSYDLLSAFMVIMVVLMLVLIVWVYRKPVKNFGKPKSRR